MCTTEEARRERERWSVVGSVLRALGVYSFFPTVKNEGRQKQQGQLPLWASSFWLRLTLSCMSGSVASPEKEGRSTTGTVTPEGVELLAPSNVELYEWLRHFPLLV